MTAKTAEEIAVEVADSFTYNENGIAVLHRDGIRDRLLMAIEADRAARPDIDEVTANRILNGAQGWVGSAVDRERMVQARHLDLVHMLAKQTEKRRADFIVMVNGLAGR